jgi:hypothetical protein
MTTLEAVAIAREHAHRQGWPFLEPVAVNRHRAWWLGPLRWTVVSNHECRGRNVRVEIDDASSSIVAAGYLPR